MRHRTHPGRSAIDLLERRNAPAEKLGSSRFEPLRPYLVAPSVMAWASRNAAEVTALLAVRHLPADGIARLTVLQEDFLFHFRNYVAAVAGARDYLFTWAKESRIDAIDAHALELKRSPAVRVLNALRARLLHGALVFSSFGSFLHLGGPSRGVCEFATQLFPAALADLRELPKTAQPLVMQIEEALRHREDWMTPVVHMSQAALEEAWQSSERVFCSRNRSLVDARLALLSHIEALEEQLDYFRDR